MDLTSVARACFRNHPSVTLITLAISFVVAVLGTRVTTALAHGSVAAETPSVVVQHAEALTQALASVATRLMTATGTERSRLEPIALTTATRRRELLSSL